MGHWWVRRVDPNPTHFFCESEKPDLDTTHFKFGWVGFGSLFAGPRRDMFWGRSGLGLKTPVDYVHRPCSWTALRLNHTRSIFPNFTTMSLDSTVRSSIWLEIIHLSLFFYNGCALSANKYIYSDYACGGLGKTAKIQTPTDQFNPRSNPQIHTRTEINPGSSPQIHTRPQPEKITSQFAPHRSG